VRYTLRSFALVAVPYVTLAVGSKEILTLLTADTSPPARLLIQIAILSVLALGFPAIVSWDPKDLFKGKV
jgi:hypothetical protein